MASMPVSIIVPGWFYMTYTVILQGPVLDTAHHHTFTKEETKVTWKWPVLGMNLSSTELWRENIDGSSPVCGGGGKP